MPVVPVSEIVLIVDLAVLVVLVLAAVAAVAVLVVAVLLPAALLLLLLLQLESGELLSGGMIVSVHLWRDGPKHKKLKKRKMKSLEVAMGTAPSSIR